MTGIIFLFSFISGLHAVLSIILFCLVVISCLDKFGNGIALRESIAVHTIFVCLIMPLVGYNYFTIDDQTSRIWVKYMRVPENDYFGYTLPAIAGFIFVMCFPINNNNISDYGPKLRMLVSRARQVLAENPKTGLQILIVGVIAQITTPLLPAAIQFAFLLFFFSAFAGFLYVFYTQSLRYRRWILIAFLLFILYTVLKTGMFTLIAYMGLTIFSFFFIDRKTVLWKKIIWFLISLFFILIIQTVKPEYRKLTWSGKFTGNQAVLFANLIADKVTNLDIGTKEAIFPLYVRTNQGFNVSLVMRRFPEMQSFDYGNNLFIVFISSFVPRFLWQDKPEAGGAANMQYYAGITLRGWSTNVGPVGEAYGSFGRIGGIIYMCILGGGIRLAYRSFFVIAQKNALLIFWIPVIFYQITYSAETDTLQIVNSLVKSAFFVWLLYKLVPSWFCKYKTGI